MPTTHKQNLEHLSTAGRGKSGVRGVSRSRNGKWYGLVKSDGERFYAGTFDTIAEAAEAVRALRCQLYTHNDLDRQEVSA